jgi:hypothetical protein
MTRVSTKDQLIAVNSHDTAVDASMRAWNNGWALATTTNALPPKYRYVVEGFDWTVPVGANGKRGKAVYVGSPTPVVYVRKAKPLARAQRSFTEVLNQRVNDVLAQYESATPAERAAMRVNVFVSKK